MISDIALMPVAGKPLMLSIGLITMVSLIATASIPTLNQLAKTHIPMKYHFWLARTTIAVALTHGLLVASTLLGF